MEPENDGFQNQSPFPGADFQVNHVKLQGCIPSNSKLSELLGDLGGESSLVKHLLGQKNLSHDAIGHISEITSGALHGIAHVLRMHPFKQVQGLSFHDPTIKDPILRLIIANPKIMDLFGRMLGREGHT